MSLLKRIESARPGGTGPSLPTTPAGPPAGGPGSGPAASPPSTAPAQRLMSSAPVRESFRDVKFRIQSRVIQDLDPKLDLSNQVEVRRQIEEIFGKVIDEEGLALTRAERVRMLEQITDEIIGLGPLEPLLRDESITEVMVNGPRQVYIERSGKLELTQRRLPERRPRHADHRPDHRPDRSPRGRVEPDGGRTPDGRVPRQRDHPAALPGRPRRHDPEVRRLPLHGGRPDPLRHGDPGDVRLPQGLRRGPAQHLRVRRDGLRQDDHAQRAVLVHPERRADHHDRGRGGAAAPPGARGDARVAAAQHRGQGRDPDPRARAELPPDAARPDHRRRVPFAARRWTCCRR